MMKSIAGTLRENFSSRKQLALLLIALVITWHVLWFYGLPPLAIAVMFLGLAGLFSLIGGAPSLLISFSLLLFTGLLGLTLKITGLDVSMYYRPHEMLEISDDRFGSVYKPQASVKMLSPFSDIQANTGVGIFEPREIEWVTDSLGYRNRKDYHGQRYVLVGDSYIAGEGNTQSCVITDQLHDQYGLDGYNLSHPGDGLPEYYNRIKAFSSLYGDQFKVLLFIYEENDLNPYEPAHYKRDNVFQRYRALFKDTSVYRYTRWMYVRAFKPTNHQKPVVISIGGKPFAFLPNYVDVVKNTADLDEQQMKWIPVLKELKNQIGHIFFIPGKYRVLAEVMDRDRNTQPLPNKQWEFLEKTAKQVGIPVTNLTDAMIHEERKLAPSGKHIFWQADTHWNCAGLAVAAREVANTIQSSK